MNFDVVLASVFVDIATLGRCQALVRDCNVAGKWQIKHGYCSASYTFERVHRFSVEAAMRHMPLLQCIVLLPTNYTLISEDPTSSLSFNLLRRQSTLITRTNHVPRGIINADRKGRYHTRRSGDGTASRNAIHTATGARLARVRVRVTVRVRVRIRVRVSVRVRVRVNVKVKVRVRVSG